MRGGLPLTLMAPSMCRILELLQEKKGSLFVHSVLTLETVPSQERN
ncbi:hypothetical protein LINPERHAP2_LOCUS1953 [Linum perenne]